MEPFKEKFNTKSIRLISKEFAKNYKSFDSKKFEKDILKELDSLELKDRVRLISFVLHKYLPKDYKKSVKLIIKTLKTDTNIEGISGFNSWPLTEFVSNYGLDHYDESLEAMIHLTKVFSSEFAIRPFIEKYKNRIFKDLTKLTKNENVHVRRWVCEGTRPTLPWGIKVENINSNIERNIPLLLKLYTDKEKYVRLSVANHLNDISKINPILMLSTCKKMLKENNTKETIWLVKHATRSLLKSGNKDAIVLNGYTKKPHLETTPLKLSKKRIHEGDKFNLSFNLKSKSKKNQKILIEYIIHYPKKNGKLSPKPFRLKDFVFAPLDEKVIKKEVHFKKVTTRVHYKGKHLIHIQINGCIYLESSFYLL